MMRKFIQLYQLYQPTGYRASKSAITAVCAAYEKILHGFENQQY